MLRKILLGCGILSSLLYVADDILAGASWRGYDFTAQAFSDYSAIGAPTRPLILLVSPIYSALVIAFGAGVWWSAGRRWSRRLIGALLVVYALVSWAWPQFFPIHLNVSEATSSDTMHIVLTVVTVLSWVLILGFGAAAFGSRFRWYSIGTLLTVLVFGALTGVIAGASQSAMTESAPWLGVAERINIYSFMLWGIVLAIGLLRAREAAAARHEEEPTPIPRAVVR